jgi:23S rRNA pseudouridine1911/1915/1917 synthase
MQQHLTITTELAGERLDKALATLAEELSRARVQALLEAGHITPAREPKYKVKAGEEYIITLPTPAPSHMLAEDLPLEVVFEDEDVLVLNKPAGLVVHPAAGHASGTLVNALLHHSKGALSGIGGVERPGIVHRLDKDTSGLMVVAKNDVAHRALSAQFADRTLSRTYLAVVWGLPQPLKGRIEAPIARDPKHRQRMAVVATGKPAATRYETIKPLSVASLVRCTLETGRTHQVRVHMAHIKCPLLGDPVYGGRRKAPLGFSRQALHAAALKFIHPKSDKEMQFEAPLPADMVGLISALEKTDKKS